ncbi:heat repeat-containing protein 2 [Chrysochromulina tobinii]|uniref:Heat repeat-containing protein 2 n=1 Tax=Chrysochromulina tobinii TaxID=1460289 RepID=A0A0M0JZJ2_9EUKA|nr:heat repeat-containing protein 2 [Chrysochromulina tobinii]|eukprot:KOO31762.1 heat repeat-containing protein 2 [Chrysochromulina sp. CCMP291]
MLADDNRQSRKRALEKLCKLAGAGTPPDVLAPLWTDQLRAPALKLFADQVEKNRELAITLASDLLAELPEVTVLGTLPWLIPAIHARVGTNPIAEVAEELRLQLLKLVAALVPRCGAALAPHLPEIVQILVMAFADPFPDAKKEGCSIAVALGGAVASHLGPHCKGLIFGLSPALAHQHSRVRSGATEALFSLILHEPSVLSDASPQISLITVDRAPAVREQAVAALAELLARLPQKRRHAARLLPLLLCALSDEVEGIQRQARLALERLGDLFAADESEVPPLDISDDVAVAAVAASGGSGTGPKDSAAKRAADAATAANHLDAMLPALLKSIEDDDEEVERSVRRAVCLLGEACAPAVYVPLLVSQLYSADPEAGSDTAVVAKRGMCLSILSALSAGAEPAALRPQLPALTAAVAMPTFCVQPPGIDDDRAATYTSTQLRLVGFLRSLIGRAGADCAADPQAYSLYCALMRLAAVPSTAGRGFEAQRRAVEALVLLAAAAGHLDTAPLHAHHMPRLVLELVGDGTDAPSTAPFAKWQAATPQWHLLQALLRQCDGATAASQLLGVVPALAHVLDPKQEPVLRGTGLALLNSLLASEAFCTAPDLDDWAELILQAMLVPNLVWRSGKAAEHVRLAAMAGIAKLLPLRALTPGQLKAQIEEALPVLTSSLDDDNNETRRLGCVAIEATLTKLGVGGLENERMRKLYPELLKRLDDASDVVRLQVCGTLVAYLRSARYSPMWDDVHNLDKSNYQYLLRGLLVHLDDPSPEIQQAMFAVLEVALNLDPPVFAAEVVAVRERHRSTKLCDRLIEQARAHGQLV